MIRIIRKPKSLHQRLHHKSTDEEGVQKVGWRTWWRREILDGDQERVWCLSRLTSQMKTLDRWRAFSKHKEGGKEELRISWNYQVSFISVCNLLTNPTQLKLVKFNMCDFYFILQFRIMFALAFVHFLTALIPPTIPVLAKTCTDCGRSQSAKEQSWIVATQSYQDAQRVTLPSTQQQAGTLNQ